MMQPWLMIARFLRTVIIPRMQSHSKHIGRIASRYALAIPYLLFLSIVTGCERPRAPGEPDQVTRNGRIVLVGLTAADPRWPAVESEARNYLKSYPNVTLTVLHPFDDSTESLIETCRNAAESRPHAACIWVSNSDGAEPAIEALSLAGAATVTVGSIPDSRLIFGHVQCSPVDAAELLGKKLGDWAGEQRSYVLLHNNGRTRMGTEAFQRFQREASRHARLILLKDACGRNSIDESSDALRGMLDTFPNVAIAATLDPRIWWNDPRCEKLGADTRLATIAAPPAIWPAIRAGKAAAAGWIDADAGRAAMEFAIQSLADRKKTERITVIEPQWVTKDTLADYSARYEAACSGNAASRPVNP